MNDLKFRFKENSYDEYLKANPDKLHEILIKGFEQQIKDDLSFKLF